MIVKAMFEKDVTTIEYVVNEYCDVGVDADDEVESFDIFATDGIRIVDKIGTFLTHIDCNYVGDIQDLIDELKDDDKYPIGSYFQKKFNGGLLTLKKVGTPKVDVELTKKSNNWSIYELADIEIDGKYLLQDGKKHKGVYHFYSPFYTIKNVMLRFLKEKYPNIVDMYINFDNGDDGEYCYLEIYAKDVETVLGVLKEFNIEEDVEYGEYYNDVGDVIKVVAKVRMQNLVRTL